MLVGQYPLDKRFEELASHFPAMDPELEKVDQYLEDEQLYRWIKADLSKRYPKRQNRETYSVQNSKLSRLFTPNSEFRTRN